MQLLELCIERDILNVWVFDKGGNLGYYNFFESYNRHVFFMYIILLNYLYVLVISSDV